MNDSIPNPNQVCLGLGGILLSFQAAYPGLRLKVHPTLLPFRSQLGPEILIHVHNEPAPVTNLSPAWFDSGGNWSLHTWQGKTVLRVRAVGPDPNRPFYVLVLEPNGESGDFYYESVNGSPPPQIVPVLGAPLDEILMVHLLAQGRGLLFHSTGVDLDGCGLLFAGTSGAGKSTLANQWKALDKAVLLGDERISARKTTNGFQICGTPWSSSAGVASPESAPLKAVFILKQASQNAAVRLQPSAAASRLLVRSFSPFWDADGMAYTLKFLDELVHAVPCYEFNFRPDISAVEYIQWLLST